MAIVRIAAGFPLDLDPASFDNTPSDDTLDGHPIVQESNLFVVADRDIRALTLEFGGYGFSYLDLGGEPVTGMVTSFAVIYRSQTLLSFEQIQLPVVELGGPPLITQRQGFVSLLAGADRLYGADQADSLWGYAGNDRLFAGRGSDTLDGGRGNDYLDGGLHRDSLNGRDGDDFLDGGPGIDRLVGGTGADVFHYGLPRHGGDQIIDFAAPDRLTFAAKSFGGLRTGQLASSRFTANAQGYATTRRQRFVFATATNTLYHDRDGSGSAYRHKIATFAGGTTLAHTDLAIV